MEGLSYEAIVTLMKPAKQHSTGGQFEGNVGGTRRSRAGNVRKLSNGRRFYVPTMEEWQAVGLCKRT